MIWRIAFLCAWAFAIAIVYDAAAQDVLRPTHPSQDPFGYWQKAIEQRQELQRRRQQRLIEIEAERRIKAEKDAEELARNPPPKQDD